MSLKKDILWRIGVVYLGFLVLALLILGRVVYLQFFEAHKWKDKGVKQVLRNDVIDANRGAIRATDGRLLAISLPYYEVRVDFLSSGMDQALLRQQLDSLSVCLYQLFQDKSAQQYKQELLKARESHNRYYLLKRRVSYEQLKQLKTFPIFRLGQYKGGLIVIQEDFRIRPNGMLAARTIGYTTKGNAGNVVGIEGAYDHELRGRQGVRLMRRIPGGVWIPVNDGNEIDPEDGKDIITTIDINLQDVAEQALLRQLNKHEAKYGTAILMEVNTGHIKAIANLKRDENGLYRETFNYAIGYSMEPGSTFKLPVLMAAMEDGYIGLNDTIHTGKGVVRYYDHKVEDTHEGGHGTLTVREVFELSSNVGTSRIITKYYKGKERRFVDRLYEMKLKQPLGLEIRGEGKPDIKYPGDRFWSGLSLPMMSFGYEVRLTPLQILTFYNAVANDGIMVKPLLVREIRHRGGVVQTFEPQIISSSICSAPTIKKAKEMLEGVVENGTAKNLRNENYRIAGKTGTAQIANEKYGYVLDNKRSYIASFVGYFPAEKPKYSCMVVVSAPSRNVYYGNLVAGPVFKEIADKVFATSADLQRWVPEKQAGEKMDTPFSKSGSVKELNSVLSLLDVECQPKVDSEWGVTTKKEDHVWVEPMLVRDDMVPNVRGMGLKDAIYLLENLGLYVEVQGRGNVLQQSLDPGTAVRRGQKIILTMSIT